jgi:PIN domain nuclease of toxin-antitoxin system
MRSASPPFAWARTCSGVRNSINGYIELLITNEHAAGVANLPDHHKDPFDRLLVAQATADGITLLTSDEILAAYTTSPIRLV